MEYRLFCVWITAMVFMVGKSIVAHRSLKKMLNREKSII